MWTIEHLGRRKSLLFGAAIQAACALIAGLVGHYYTDVAGVTDSMVKTGGNVLIAFAVIHVSMYSLFWGPTPCECFEYEQFDRPVIDNILPGRGHPGRDLPSPCSTKGDCSCWYVTCLLKRH